MPRGDGTGPNGMGPMTGRAAGYCAGYNTPGFANPGGGRGFRMGFGGGFGRGRGGHGWRNMYYATGLPGWARAGMAPDPAQQPGAQVQSGIDPQAELNTLKTQAQSYQNTLEDINRRIEELEKNAAENE